MRTKLIIIGIVVVALLAGTVTWIMSQKPEWTAAPEGFVEVDDGRFAWKAVSPDGSVIAIRMRPNEGEGDLTFWREVFELEMVEGKGYRLADDSEVTSKDGVPGVLLQFEYAQSDTPFHYGLAVYVTAEWIVTLETATELELYDKYASAFEAARSELDVSTVESPFLN